MKRLITMGLMILFLFSICGVASAHDLSGFLLQPQPLQVDVPDGGYPDEPGGTTLPDSGQIGIRHFYPGIHLHQMGSITNTYDTMVSRGEVASGYNGKPGADQLSFTIQKEVSNGWNANIGFSSDVVSGGVGFDVTWSDTKSWGYTATVNSHKTCHIGLKDCYHVKTFNCATIYYNTNGQITNVESGNGWARQWYKPHFWSWET